MKQKDIFEKIYKHIFIIVIFSIYLLSFLLSFLLSYFLIEWAIIYAFLFSMPFFLITLLLLSIVKKTNRSKGSSKNFYISYVLYFVGKNLLIFLPFIIIYILNVNDYNFLNVWGALIGVIIQQVVNLSYLLYNKKKDIKMENLSEHI